MSEASKILYGKGQPRASAPENERECFLKKRAADLLVGEIIRFDGDPRSVTAIELKRAEDSLQVLVTLPRRDEEAQVISFDWAAPIEVLLLKNGATRSPA